MFPIVSQGHEDGLDRFQVALRRTHHVRVVRHGVRLRRIPYYPMLTSMQAGFRSPRGHVLPAAVSDHPISPLRRSKMTKSMVSWTFDLDADR